MMATHGADATFRTINFLTPKGLIGKLFDSILKIFGLQDVATNLANYLKNILAKLTPKDLLAGVVNSTDGAVEILASGPPSFDWREIFGGWQAAVLIIFINVGILLWEYATTDMKAKVFWEKVGICLRTTIASQIAGNVVRELCSAIVTAFFSPVWAAHWATKFACWFFELGFSLVAAHVTNKKLDPKAYCLRAFCKENEKVLKEDYEKALLFLGVSH